MGYSAQVQQSPNQFSGKVGTQQQMTDATKQAVGNVTDAVQPQGKGGSVGQPVPAYMPLPAQVGISQADMGINSGAPHQSTGKGGSVGDSGSTPTFIADAAGIVNRQKDLEATPEFQEARRLEIANPARPSGPSGSPMGKGGRQTNSATSGQPRVGQPNLYPNTVGMRDNMQQQLPKMGGGKGKV